MFGLSVVVVSGYGVDETSSFEEERFGRVVVVVDVAVVVADLLRRRSKTMTERFGRLVMELFFENCCEWLNRAEKKSCCCLGWDQHDPGRKELWCHDDDFDRDG